MDKTVVYIVKGMAQYEPSWTHSLWYSKDAAEKTAEALTEMAEAEECNDEFFVVDEYQVKDG